MTFCFLGIYLRTISQWNLIVYAKFSFWHIHIQRQIEFLNIYLNFKRLHWFDAICVTSLFKIFTTLSFIIKFLLNKIVIKNSCTLWNHYEFLFLEMAHFVNTKYCSITQLKFPYFIYIISSSTLGLVGLIFDS